MRPGPLQRRFLLGLTRVVAVAAAVSPPPMAWSAAGGALAGFAAQAAFAAPPPASAPGTTGERGKRKLADRVLAVVDDDPILESDLGRALGLGFAHPNPGETERAFRRRLLDDLIAERLRFHEIDRFGFEQVPVSEIEKHVAEIRARFKDQATFQARLKDLGLDLAALRQLVARQLEVLAYVDERLGPQVFVGLDDIANYYKTVLVPEMQRQHKPVPPLDEMREQIRAVLREQRLTKEIDAWTAELRSKANIAVYFDQPEGGPLPPVVKRFDRPPPPAGGKKPPAPKPPA
jgi:hypothetical protein